MRHHCAMPSPAEFEVAAPLAGVVVAIECPPGESVRVGGALVVLEAMKMEHEVLAEADGIVRRVEVAVGDAVQAGELLVVLSAVREPALATTDAPLPGDVGSQAKVRDGAEVADGTDGVEGADGRADPPDASN